MNAFSTSPEFLHRTLSWSLKLVCAACKSSDHKSAASLKSRSQPATFEPYKEALRGPFCLLLRLWRPVTSSCWLKQRPTTPPSSRPSRQRCPKNSPHSRLVSLTKWKNRLPSLGIWWRSSIRSLKSLPRSFLRSPKPTSPSLMPSSLNTATVSRPH